MKFKIQLCVLAIAIGFLTFCSAARSEDRAADESRKADARAILTEGAKADVMPADMVIRIGACLGDPRKSGANVPAGLVESWEFTSNQVHRVEAEYKDGKVVYRRVESRPFVSKDLCKTLLEGKAVEIATGKGEGERIGFVGSDYAAGSRSIDMIWQGKDLLDLGETNGPALVLYRESDAKAFGALYEKLATQAREAFKSPVTKPAR